MNTYETMILLDNREVKKGWDALKQTIDGVLTRHGGEIVVAKRWDERKLAYEIKGQRRATYYLSYLKTPPESIELLRHDLKLTQPVLRHLILRVDEIPEAAYEPEREFTLVEDSRDSSTEDEPESSDTDDDDDDDIDDDVDDDDEADEGDEEGGRETHTDEAKTERGEA